LRALKKSHAIIIDDVNDEKINYDQSVNLWRVGAEFISFCTAVIAFCIRLGCCFYKCEGPGTGTLGQNVISVEVFFYALQFVLQVTTDYNAYKLQNVIVGIT